MAIAVASALEWYEVVVFSAVGNGERAALDVIIKLTVVSYRLKKVIIHFQLTLQYSRTAPDGNTKINEPNFAI